MRKTSLELMSFMVYAGKAFEESRKAVMLFLFIIQKADKLQPAFSAQNS